MPTRDGGSVVSSSLMVGVVQRKDVDTSYTCLASNSDMTQASRAEVTLQMNRECANVTKTKALKFAPADSILLRAGIVLLHLFVAEPVEEN